MLLQRFLLLSVVVFGLADCTPRLHGSYMTQVTLSNPDRETLTFRGNRFHYCYDGVNSGRMGSGTFTFNKSILLLHFDTTAVPALSTEHSALLLSRSLADRVLAGTVYRYKYMPAGGRHAGFQLAHLWPIDTTVHYYKRFSGSSAEALKEPTPVFRFYRRISATEAGRCFAY
ncbi:hypothetical protein [Hymenobacter metallilatus]|uniref:Uncharacterized protein n=1 Tax=Hymenobacter metallilatus TaxID=2493666 RepID=A0A3R9MKX9_9BACT|nr:hypothetical protein [Hymenobacter metallilatus]RSK23964.1 hypothetical protein EI290_21490 [Hymenobacter metallilatus]